MITKIDGRSACKNCQSFLSDDGIENVQIGMVITYDAELDDDGNICYTKRFIDTGKDAENRMVCKMCGEYLCDWDEELVLSILKENKGELWEIR